MMQLRYPNGLRKALTLSYDDGVEQDIRLMEILDKYGLKCTFNLNSGCYSPEGKTWPAGTIHRRLPESRVSELYRNPNHEVAVHCLTHASLVELPREQVVTELMKDRENLEKMFGGIITGMAYPFGTYNDEVVEILRTCGFRFARTVNSTGGFFVPQDWLRLPATCHHNDPRLMKLADDFVAMKPPFDNKLFYLWGHSYEFEANNNWEVIEAFAEKTGGKDDIWYCTNSEVCNYTLMWKRIETSVDGRMIHNPTDMTFWFEKDSELFKIGPGEWLDTGKKE